MAYGLKYQTQFSSISDDNNPERLYTLQFLFKDYAGNPATIEGGGTTCVQKWSDDNPVSPIKGSSLEISLVNPGNIPITAFQSEDDDGVQVILLDENSNVLFKGYLVQDDFSELMVDYDHTIQLSANDGLGLLKGVTLSDAEVRRSFYAVRQTNGVNTVVYVYVASTAFYPQAGNIIEFLGSSYTIATAVKETTVISSIVYNWTITLTTDTGGISYGDEYIFLTGEVNLLERNDLLSMIAVCLAQTNLSLITNVFMNLYAQGQDNTRSCLPQTLIDSKTFLNGDLYDDCYTALIKILETFNFTLAQSAGQWQIINWFEVKQYTANAIPGFVFNETWAEIGTTVLNNQFVIGPDPELTQPIFELRKTSYRGWKFSRKKFEYRNPKYILRNNDLQQLGDLRSDYISGGVHYYEYDAPGWTGGETPVYVDRFIRVSKDAATGNEINRELVVRGDPGTISFAKSVRSDPIEIRTGDKIKISFSVKGENSLSGTWTLVYAMMLTDGTLLRYIDDLPAGNADWISTIGFTYNGSGNNTNNYNTVEIESSRAPYTGLFYVYLTQLYTNGDETMYKDIRLEVIPLVNDSSRIIAQVHTQTQTTNKKNNSDELIYIDDSPRNTIAGTLFLPTLTSLVQDLTTFWRYPPDANAWRLGERSTLQELTWRQKTRQQYEGGFTGLWQNGQPANMLTMAKFSWELTKNYTFGLLTIDYKRNEFSGTLWEIFDEQDGEFDPDYEFKYIYSTT